MTAGDCDGSRKYVSRKFDGSCPVCQASVGMTREGRVKVHKPGIPTRVITGGGRIRNYQ